MRVVGYEGLFGGEVYEKQDCDRCLPKGSNVVPFWVCSVFWGKGL